MTMLATELDRGPWMSTFTGKRFYFLDPRPEDVCIEDITHSLARIARFGGHTVGPMVYPVAQHAVHVAERLHLAGASARVVFAGLHHDDPEAYTGDTIAPLKRAMKIRDGGRRWSPEVGCQVAIESALGIPALTEEEDRQIKTADMRMLVTEARALLVDRGAGWTVQEQPYDDLKIVPWSISDAEIAYRHWHEIGLAMMRAESR